jgi:ubiquitin carboxyl-terminal hydrolase 4/11/15
LIRDTSNIASSAAYLLFYRRRSETPLGGSRFAAIVEKYDDTDGSLSGDEKEAGGSSPQEPLHGGTAVELAAGLLGAGRVEGTSTTVHRGPGGVVSRDEDELPSYEAVRNSIEDEGIEMSEGDGSGGVQGAYITTWNFSTLKNQRGSASDDGLPRKGKGRLVEYDSEDAQQDSNSDRDDLGAVVDPSLGMDDGIDEGRDDSLPDYQEAIPAPSAFQQVQLTQIQSRAWNRIPVSREDGSEEAVAEIRLDED